MGKDLCLSLSTREGPEKIRLAKDTRGRRASLYRDPGSMEKGNRKHPTKDLYL